MKYVTYQAGGGARVGRFDGATVVDVGFEGDMTAFIEASAPTGPERPVPDARLLAPIRPRSLRDFLAFEGHLKNAFKNLGREILAEWYEVPVIAAWAIPSSARTPSCPGRSTPANSTTSPSWPQSSAGWAPRRQGGRGPRLRLRLHYLERHVRLRRPAPRAAGRHGPGQGQGVGRVQRPGPLHRHHRRDRPGHPPAGVRINGERWGGDTTANMHYSFGDLIAYASQDQTLRPGDVLGSGTVTGGSGLSWTVGSAPVTSSRWRPARSASCNTVGTPTTRKDTWRWHMSSPQPEGQARRVSRPHHRGHQDHDPLSRQEPGNLFYQAQVSPDEPETFFLYEQYTDAQAYEDHKNSEHFQKHVRVRDRLPRRAQRQDLPDDRCLTVLSMAP